MYMTKQSFAMEIRRYGRLLKLLTITLTIKRRKKTLSLNFFSNGEVMTVIDLEKGGLRPYWHCNKKIFRLPLP